jgi:hypothetical protein
VNTDLAEAAHVDRARKGRRLRGLRRHLISRVCALSIITLVLVPFTPPFKTYVLAGSSGGHGHDGLPKDKIHSDEKLVGVSTASLVAPAPDMVGVEPSTGRNQIDERHLRATILRI